MQETLLPHGARRLIVRDAAEFRTHQLAEYIIRRRKHLRPASEVFVEIDSLLAFPVLRIRMIFFQKQLRPRQAESVDALLDIANHKPVPSAFLLAGHCREQCLLDKVAVLILIDHNFAELFRKLPRRIGPHQAAVFLLHENFKRKVFQIGIIENIFAPFFLRKRFCKLLRQINQHPDGSRQSAISSAIAALSFSKNCSFNFCSSFLHASRSAFT